MSDRIAVMHQGRVEQLGTPEELYERPSTRFVADFIGTTNLLSRVHRIDGRSPALVRLEAATPVASPHDGLRAGRTSSFRIRPESIVMKPRTATAPSGEPLRGQSSRSAYLGGNVQYQVRTLADSRSPLLAPKDRAAPPGRQRRRHRLATGRGARPRRPSGPSRRRSRHERTIRRLDDRSREGARSATWSSSGDAAGPARADRAGRRRPRHSRR